MGTGSLVCSFVDSGFFGYKLDGRKDIPDRHFDVWQKDYVEGSRQVGGKEIIIKI
jgi:hypothetical protein